MGDATDRQMNKLASRLAVKHNEVGAGRRGAHEGWQGLSGLVSCLIAAKAPLRSTSEPKVQTVSLLADIFFWLSPALILVTSHVVDSISVFLNEGFVRLRLKSPQIPQIPRFPLARFPRLGHPPVDGFLSNAVERISL